MFQEGLIALLKADAGVSTLVSYFFAVEPADDNRYPCVSYALVGGDGTPALNSGGPNFQRLELSAYSMQSYGEADKIRTAVIRAVDGWRQTLGNGVRVENAVLINPATDFVTEQSVFRCLCEFRVQYNQPN